MNFEELENFHSAETQEWLWLGVNPGIVTEMIVRLFMQSFILTQLSSCHVPSTVSGAGIAVVSKGAVIPSLIISVISITRVQEAIILCMSWVRAHISNERTEGMNRH